MYYEIIISVKNFIEFYKKACYDKQNQHAKSDIRVGYAMKLIKLWDADLQKAYELQNTFDKNEHGFVNNAYGLSFEVKL